jgi:hypothetical protein
MGLDGFGEATSPVGWLGEAGSFIDGVVFCPTRSMDAMALGGDRKRPIGVKSLCVGTFHFPPDARRTHNAGQ